MPSPYALVVILNPPPLHDPTKITDPVIDFLWEAELSIKVAGARSMGVRADLEFLLKT
jgi:hypothetical protein